MRYQPPCGTRKPEWVQQRRTAQNAAPVAGSHANTRAQLSGNAVRHFVEHNRLSVLNSFEALRPDLKRNGAVVAKLRRNRSKKIAADSKRGTTRRSQNSYVRLELSKQDFEAPVCTLSLGDGPIGATELHYRGDQSYLRISKICGNALKQV